MTKKRLSKIAMYAIAMLENEHIARGLDYHEAFLEALKDADVTEKEYIEIQNIFTSKS